MYNHIEIEKKWQNYWETSQTFRTPNPDEILPDGRKARELPKFFALDMFPYPSGAGLHVGHPEGYTANDIVARYKHAKGYNVLHPMGWDAFGLPAENYAIKTGIHPKITTAQNIATFKRQIQNLGFSYDWSREIDTTDPEYYKWTQWIFLKLFEHGLAYEQDLPINYCPSCKTGLSNEEVLGDFSCERCGTQVEKKKIRQWVLAITKYAERLLSDVDDLDWPEGIKDMQRNWIGKSEGCEFEMKVVQNVGNADPRSLQEIGSIRVYTTRVDTVFGMTYSVIAPDHSDVVKFITAEQKVECEAYIKKASQQSDQDRTADGKEKTGVFTGSYVINPYNGEEVPLWIADYVLGNYGTGAVMAVPAHDERDFEFAKKYGLEITGVIKPIVYSKTGFEKDIENIHKELEKEFTEILEGKKCYTKIGLLINSGDFDRLTSEEAKQKFAEMAQEKGFGHKKVNYKLRDWLFSRQRYWGEPIPLIHLDPEDVKAIPRVESLDEEMEAGKAYILTQPSSQPSPLEEKERATSEVKNEASLSSKGERIQEGGEQSVEEFLIINGKIFSKIYDGIYTKIVCDYSLPLKLPQVEKYEPAGDGQSPLASIDDFVHVRLADNLSGKRETNTMPQWGGSCWYYLRFMDAKNPEELVSKEVENYWGSVDSYVGGAEHAVLHLLYARFWHKFLYDIGVVSTIEPFYRLRNQGMILGMSYKTTEGRLIASDLVQEVPVPGGTGTKYISTETGEELQKIPAKMSKSLKNVINPDDIVREYGADTLRLYEMYMGDFADSKPWDTTAIIGCRRFLDKVYALYMDDKEKYAESDEKAMKTLHKTIKKITEDIEHYKFNTALAQMMICLNTGLPKSEAQKVEWKEIFLKLLHPFAPHIAEECWEKTSSQPSPLGEKEQATDDIHAVLLSSKGEEIQRGGKYLKIYYATGNEGKIKRAQSILDSLKSGMTIEKIPELIEVEENEKTPLECALQKLEVYKDKGYKIPVMTADTAVYFEKQDFEPTKVRRAAIEASRKLESELTKMEIAELMIEFYKNIATQHGGQVDFYYIDAFAVLFPHGEIKTQEYKRAYTLTNESKGDIYPDAPMRSLYISKVTGKRAHETLMQDYLKEFSCQVEAFQELFGSGKSSIFFEKWPEYDEAMTVDSEVTIGVQVIGKLRGEIQISVDEVKDSVLAKAKANPDVARWLEGKEIVKEIYVPGKIVNIVVK